MGNISNIAKKLSSDKHIEKSRNVGDYAEKLFAKLTNATLVKGIDNMNHVDFIIGDKLIDVKGLKNSVDSGYVLIEFIGVSGFHGWCHHKSMATHIAFLTPDDQFILVNNEDLRKKTLSLCGILEFDTLDDVSERVYRTNNPADLFNGYENIKYELYGRDDRKDVYTYITLNDILTLDYEIIK